MSFAWDQWYIVLLDDWESSDEYWVCADLPRSSRRQAEQIEAFDEVQYLMKDEYDVERGSRVTVSYTPEDKEYRGYVSQLSAKPQASAKYLKSARERSRGDRRGSKK